VAGERFVVLKADDRSLYGKKVRFSDGSVFPRDDADRKCNYRDEKAS